MNSSQNLYFANIHKKISAIFSFCISISLFFAVSAAAKVKPGWITKPPPPNEKYVYFVGINTSAESIESGKSGAVEDIAKQIVEYIGMKISTKIILQKTELITLLADESRSYSKADIRGAVIEEMYYEKDKKEKRYEVYVLTRYLKKEIEKEKERIKKILQEYDIKINQLAGEILAGLKSKNIGQILIGGFKELVSQRRYSFSDILENDLKTRIMAGSINISENQQEEYILTGAYRAQGNDVIVSVNIMNRMTKTNIFAKNIFISQDVLEPGWLNMEKTEDSIFSELDEIPRAAGKTGTLSVSSDPMEAQIFFDGDYRGKTNVDLRQVPAGPHNVALVKDKYEVYVKTIEVSEGQVSEVNTRLELKRGALSVKTYPEGARVSVDKKQYGFSPQVIKDLPVGEYILSIAKKGYKDYSGKIEIYFNETLEKIIDLTEEDGSLLVTASPVNAKVYIDSEYAGLAAPLFLDKVSSGDNFFRRFSSASTNSARESGPEISSVCSIPNCFIRC